jgi:hypothetical protein
LLICIVTVSDRASRGEYEDRSGPEIEKLLRESLADPLIRDEAIDLLRGLIDEVRLSIGEDGWSAELQGEITSLVTLGLQDDKAPRPGLRVEALC